MARDVTIIIAVIIIAAAIPEILGGAIDRVKGLFERGDETEEKR